MKLTILANLCLADKFKPETRRTKGQVCLGLANGIEAWMTKTRKGNFGGGNTKWEEKKLGKWATSETRLLEVIENACGGGYGSIDLQSMDMTKAGKNADCYTMLEQHEEWIEEWYEDDPDANEGDFYVDFCVKKLKTNCKKKTQFGSKCKECPKNPKTNLVCSEHGTCVGASDKEGKGGCECRDNWTGTYCQECHEDYYEKDDECHRCHESCKTCSGPKSKHCKACAAGFVPKKLSNGDFECRRETSDEKHKRESKKDEL